MTKRLCLALALITCTLSMAQLPSGVRIDPPHWWVGFKQTRLQLLVLAPNLPEKAAKVNHPGLRIVGQQVAEDPDYLVVDLELGPELKPGGIILQITGSGGKTLNLPYTLKARENIEPKGLSQADCIYLLMPDRFANGNAANDVVKGMQQTTLNRDSLLLRHGGDVEGVIQHLDYIDDLGATALWLNPVQENDQPLESYHGYAITDHYRIDPRLGNLDVYKQMVVKCHERSMKVVMDVVPNHLGNRHYLYRKLPFSDWVHRWPEYTRTSYRASTRHDPHAAQRDKKIFADGWFDKHMPDLNQQHTVLANYLIQNAIWWVEETHLDAYRIDTYAYPDQDFMHRWNAALFAEYPTLGMFGEVWDHAVPIQSYYTRSSDEKIGSDALPGVTDFQANSAILEALNNPAGWTEGTSRLYYVFGQDYLYPQPERNVVFLDNHDVSRFAAQVGNDSAKIRMGIGLLLSLRGIPMWYYGTELGFSAFSNPDAKVRPDFPGGWKGDARNLFVPQGRSGGERSLFEFSRRLLQYRKTSDALCTGRMVHFVPEQGVYAYARVGKKQRILCLFNPSGEAKTLDGMRFSEITEGFTRARDVLSGIEATNLRTFDLPAKSLRWFELIP